jgi:leader peptidase (prepilin peptidase) / N-methyltransferase
VTLGYCLRVMICFLVGGLIARWLHRCLERWPEIEEVGASYRAAAKPWVPRGGSDRTLAGWRALPILGWWGVRDVPLRARRRYLVVELLTAVLFAGLYLCEVPEWSANPLLASSTYHVGGPLASATAAANATWLLHVRYLFHAGLLVFLVVATFIDLDHKIIPDAITLPGGIWAVAGQLLTGCMAIVPVWYQDPRGLTIMEIVAWTMSPDGSPPQHLAWLGSLRGTPAWATEFPHWHGLAVAVAGLVVGGGAIWGVRWVGFRALGREAMGFGDVTLMAMIGAAIGWQPAIAVFVLAPMCAAGVAFLQWLLSGQRELPFGPYLSLATVLMLLFGQTVLPPFESLLSFFGPALPLVVVWLLATLWAMLVFWRGVQRLLGWDDGDDELVDVWSSADQLQFLASEQSDPSRGQWANTSNWPGVEVGMGLRQEHVWKSGES